MPAPAASPSARQRHPVAAPCSTLQPAHACARPLPPSTHHKQACDPSCGGPLPPPFSPPGPMRHTAPRPAPRHLPCPLTLPAAVLTPRPLLRPQPRPRRGTRCPAWLTQVGHASPVHVPTWPVPHPRLSPQHLISRRLWALCCHPCNKTHTQHTVGRGIAPVHPKPFHATHASGAPPYGAR